MHLGASMALGANSCIYLSSMLKCKYSACNALFTPLLRVFSDRSLLLKIIKKALVWLPPLTSTTSPYYYTERDACEL
jgi:hypothetical protein